MSFDFGMDGPITRREFQSLIVAVSTEAFYIKADEYRRKIGIGKTMFQNLKNLGRFDKGTHPATLGSKRVLIHRYFNMHTQQIELPCIQRDKITPNKRGKHGKVKKDKAAGSNPNAGASEFASKHTQGCASDAGGAHLPGSAQ
jgi:hypothetical protein